MSQQTEHITRLRAPVAAEALRNSENKEYFEQLHQLRKEANAEIDRLIAFLDDLDGDPNLEETGDDEPSLGWRDGRGCGADPTGGNDTELDDCDDEDDGSGEPSLGAPESYQPIHLPFGYPLCSRTPEGSQARWSQGNRRDLEQEVGDDNREAVDAD